MAKRNRNLIWDGPSVPPSNDINNPILNDLSCQGIVGITLYKALQSVNNKNEINQCTSSCSTDGEGSHKDERINQEVVTNSSSTNLKLQQKSIDRIMTNFGKVLNDLNHIETKSFVNNNQSNVRSYNTTNDHTVVVSPSALLRGNLVYSNRINNKWRLYVHDAMFIERKQLDINRRLREKQSLWKVCEKQRDDMKLSNTILTNKLELLVYDEIEQTDV